MLRRAFLALLLGLLTTIAIAWTASLQTTRGMVVLPGMAWRQRTGAEGEGWLRAHSQYKPAWRCTMSQAVPLLTYSNLPPNQLTPESVLSGRARRLALPWLDGSRPWPASSRGENVDLHDYGWPLHALYTRRVYFFSGPTTLTDLTDHLWNLRSIGWFDHRPLGDIRGLPIGPIWPGLLADALIWSIPWAALCFARPLRIALRLRRHHCPHCNYDLAATPPDAPCPECGRTTPSNAASTQA